MRYEDSMKGVADQIIKEQQRASKIHTFKVHRSESSGKPCEWCCLGI